MLKIWIKLIKTQWSNLNILIIKRIIRYLHIMEYSDIRV